MPERATPQPVTASLSGPLKGSARVSGDRSIAHRAIILASVAAGETRISGLPDNDDLRRTIAAMRAFGARVEGSGADWIVQGVGNGCLLEPDRKLDFAGSAEGAQLIMGLVSGYDMRTDFLGDAATTRRPLGRVLDPLRLMGVQVHASAGDRLPLTLRGPKVAAPITFRVPLASALVKSCILLAGLNTPGITTVIESLPTPDHTERMLRTFGAQVSTEVDAGGLRQIRVSGQGRLTAQPVTIPGDPALAAPLIVAALIVPGSDVTIEGVLTNETRIGLISTLRDMGGSIQLFNRRSTSGEDIADLRVRHSELHGVSVPHDRAPSMAEEIQALAVAAAFAEGETRLQGLDDLRAGDRLRLLVDAMKANGIQCEEVGRDGLLVRGAPGGAVPGGGRIETRGDAQLATACLAMGLAAARPVQVDDDANLAAAFDEVISALRRLGAAIG